MEFSLSAHYTANAPETAPKFDDRQPTRVTWEMLVYDFDTPGEVRLDVSAWDADFERLAIFRDLDQVPDWVPRPPDGWDLGVRIHAERRLIEAEQSEQVPA